VVQIGAAIGREFSYELLAAVAGLADPVLQDALARLIEAELVFIRGTPPNAVYSFKHTLVQDTAYSTMLRVRRQQLHSAIAMVLEKRFPEIASSTPEVLAQQFEGADRAEQAIHYWRKAGDRDLHRFAMKESLAHYTNALRVVMTLPESTARSEHELQLCLALALTQQIALGPSAKESADYYRRADSLSKSLAGHGREHFLATWGLWLHCFMTDQPHEASRRADDMIAIARQVDNPDLLMEAFHARTAVLQRRGDFHGIMESAEEVLRRYDRQRHREHAYFFGGHDARVCVRSFYSMGLWGLGFFDQAREMVRKCVEDARDLGHAFSLCHGLHQSGLTLILLGDVDACQAVIDELLPIAERNKFPWPLAMGQFMQGWLIAQRGDPAGIKPMQASAEHPTAGVRRPVLQSLAAEELRRAGQPEEALKAIEGAIKLEAATGYRLFQPEMARLRAQILLDVSRANESEAEAGFLGAIKLARDQACRAIELRAATSLAQLYRDQGRHAEARDLLAPVYGSFTEGFRWPDLKAAKALLDEPT
jgi:predicted ATPase